jgi:hypothetical protein
VAGEEGRTGRSAAWGVAAVLFGGGAFATWPVAVAPNSTFPVWPTYVFGGIAGLALYVCFATILSWWPTARSVRGSSTGTAEPGGIGYVAGQPDSDPRMSATVPAPPAPQPIEGHGPEINHMGIVDDSSRVKNELGTEVVTLEFDDGGAPLAVLQNMTGCSLTFKSTVTAAFSVQSKK